MESCVWTTKVCATNLRHGEGRELRESRAQAKGLVLKEQLACDQDNMDRTPSHFLLFLQWCPEHFSSGTRDTKAIQLPSWFGRHFATLQEGPSSL